MSEPGPAASTSSPTCPHEETPWWGHDVWIDYQAIVMPSVHIGNGAVVASESVVTGHV